MFCRFCGEEIPIDSEFCQFCGRNLGTYLSGDDKPIINERAHSKGMNLNKLSKISSIFFYVGIVAFLLLFIKMAPGIGSIKFLSYMIGAATTIALAVLINRIKNGKATRNRQLIALVFGLLLLIPSIGLRIVYECKVDAVTADIPISGKVYLSMTTNEEFFSYISDGYVENPSSNIRIGDKWLEGSATFEVELNKKYEMRVTTGYSGNHNYTDTQIIFTASKLNGGYTVVKKVSLDKMEYAEVTISFERVCSFWDVIFH